MEDKLNSKLQKLEKFKSQSNNVVSIYLGSKEEKGFSRKLLISELNSLIHSSFDKEEKDKFSQDLEKIKVYLDLLRNEKRGIAFFSSGKDLWSVLEFDFPFESKCVIADVPFLGPIQDVLNSSERYLVLLIDRKKSILFSVFLDKIEETVEIPDGEIPQRIKSKPMVSYSMRSQQNFITSMRDKHLAEVSRSVEEFVKGKDIKYILIGGHKDLLNTMKKQLPTNLRNLVKAEFITELNIPLNDIFLKVKEINLS